MPEVGKPEGSAEPDPIDSADEEPVAAGDGVPARFSPTPAA